MEIFSDMTFVHHKRIILDFFKPISFSDFDLFIFSSIFFMIDDACIRSEGSEEDDGGIIPRLLLVSCFNDFFFFKYKCNISG